MEPKVDKKNRGLKIVLWITAMVIVMLAIVAIIVLVKKAHEKTDEERVESEAAEQEMVNEAYKIYRESGAESVLDFYKTYIESAKSTKEKAYYLENSVSDLSFVCGWDCSDQIIENIHELASISDDGSVLEKMCFYEDLYVDSEPIDVCKESVEEEVEPWEER